MVRHDEHSWHRQVAHERHNPYQGAMPMMTKMKRSRKAATRRRTAITKHVFAGVVGLLAITAGTLCAAHEMTFLIGGL